MTDAEILEYYKEQAAYQKRWLEKQAKRKEEILDEYKTKKKS